MLDIDEVKDEEKRLIRRQDHRIGAVIINVLKMRDRQFGSPQGPRYKEASVVCAKTISNFSTSNQWFSRLRLRRMIRFWANVSSLNLYIVAVFFLPA